MSKKTLTGQVVSDKMTNTVVVAIDTSKKHPIYGKTIRRTKRIKARNEINAKTHDIVMIEECAPYSKEVNWKVVNIVKEGGSK